MRLGAQFYSIRNECTNHEQLRESFRRIKEIGYEIVQISGVCDIEAERLKSYIDEFSLPVTCTHKPFELIVNATDELIRYHKVIDCPVIGIGAMPTVYHGSLEGARAFIRDTSEAVKKINAAGLAFAYHNHAFEFDVKNPSLFDVLIEEAPDISFILDVYWTKYADVDCMKYIELFGKEKRMTNIHLKDMKSEPKGPICPCGEGITDFKPILALCETYGIENALVEQDNAPDSGDSIGQMKISYDNLAPIFGR